MTDVIVKTYEGTQNDASKAFQLDAAKMAGEGYSPINQNYIQGQWTCGQFLIALLLCLIIVGIIALIYMMIVKPPGVLTVTYQRVGASV